MPRCGDASVNEDELALLEPGRWMNDALIYFVEEHLQLTEAEDDPRVCFMSPNVAFLSTCLPAAESRAVLAPLKLETRELLFIPINDSIAGDDKAVHSATPRGSHWTLLVWHRRHGFVELNTMPARTVSPAASQMAAAVGLLLDRSMGRSSAVRLLTSPGQNNSWDCGMYVCAMMKRILELFLDDSQLSDFFARGIRDADIPQRAIEAERRQLRAVLDAYRKAG